ncbi:response regulator [Paenibacillus sp. PL91]|uniref:response regulator n=1 Tax=Paenibacillus sp. PL91 TaxID=2729538 RepID=UPI00145EEDA4|nr:response regulator [Paenibacillus sp. PL91]MBC9201961.1 response regulator [Paenibacillus sp. PL91]
MKAILIDDEKPALLQLERLLVADGRIEIRGKFTTFAEGKVHLAQEKADIVFLDIEMPDINGLEAAEYIQQMDSAITIVFVTAFSEYAVEAFEVQALDYLLKPVYPARLAKTIDRITADAVRFEVQADYSAALDEGAQILCLGKLVLRSSPDRAEPFKWRTLKSHELFAYLLHHKGKWLDKDQIIETLWSDYAPDKAINHLHTSIYQVRKLLKDWMPNIKVEFERNCYRLTIENLIMDTELFEKAAEQPMLTEQNLKYYESLLALYRGDYLEELDCVWVLARREQLRRLYMQIVIAVAAYELEIGRGSQAVLRLNELQEREPYSDEICRQMLLAYKKLNDKAALQRYYEAFEELVRKDLKIEPELRTKALYEQLYTQLKQG